MPSKDPDRDQPLTWKPVVRMNKEKTMNLRLPLVRRGSEVGFQDRAGRVHSNVLLGVLIAGWSIGFTVGVVTTMVAFDLFV